MTIERMEWSEAVRLKKTRYYNGNPCKHGHIAQRATSNRQCIRCKSDADNLRKKSKEYKEDLWNLIGVRLRSMRKKDRIKFNYKLETTREDLLRIYNQTYRKWDKVHRCQVLNIELTTRSGDNVLSFDRIDNSKPHTKDNLICVSWKANRIRNENTADEILKVGRWLKRQEKKHGLYNN